MSQAAGPGGGRLLGVPGWAGGLCVRLLSCQEEGGVQADLSGNGHREQLEWDIWVLKVPCDSSQGPRSPQRSPANRCTPTPTKGLVGQTGRVAG